MTEYNATERREHILNIIKNFERKLDIVEIAEMLYHRQLGRQSKHAVRVYDSCEKLCEEGEIQSVRENGKRLYFSENNGLTSQKIENIISSTSVKIGDIELEINLSDKYNANKNIFESLYLEGNSDGTVITLIELKSIKDLEKLSSIFPEADELKQLILEETKEMEDSINSDWKRPSEYSMKKRRSIIEDYLESCIIPKTTYEIAKELFDIKIENSNSKAYKDIQNAIQSGDRIEGERLNGHTYYYLEEEQVEAIGHMESQYEIMT